MTENILLFVTLSFPNKEGKLSERFVKKSFDRLRMTDGKGSEGIKDSSEKRCYCTNRTQVLLYSSLPPVSIVYHIELLE